MKKLWILLFALPLFSQVVPGRYIVELEGEPAISVAARQRKQHRAELRVAQQRIRRSLEAQSAQVVDSLDTVANGFIVRIPDSQAHVLSSIPGVIRVSRVHRARLLLDRAVVLHRITDAWNRLPDPGKAGAGVRIAVIDTGIDPGHPGFQDPSLEIPAGVVLPFEGKNKILVARSYEYMHGGTDNSPRDIQGHGTAVAMAAAGVYHSAPLASISGSAPKAWIGVYRIPLYSDSILKALDDAVADGMEIVNLSIGLLAPFRPNVDPLYQSLERLSAAGVIVVQAAGNDGPLPATTVVSAPSVVAVGAAWSDRQFVTGIRVKDGPAVYALPGDGQWPVDSVSGPLFDVASVDPTGFGCMVLDPALMAGKIAIILRGECTFEDKINNAAASGAAGAIVYNDEARKDIFRMSTGSAVLPAESVTYGDGMALRARLSDDPNLTVTLSRNPIPVSVDSNRLASFSGRGPSAGDGVKPDLVAVGEEVYTAAQKVNDAGDIYDPTGYAIVNGTSFSAPITAGAFAVLKSARPGLTASQYRSLVINSATPFVVNGMPAPVQQAGAGLLNLDSAMRSTIAASPTSISFGVGGGTVESMRFLNVTNLGAVSDTFSVTLSQLGDGPAPALSANTLTLEPGASTSFNLLFTANNASVGEYQGFILIRGTQSEVEARIPYWYAVASTDPAHIRVIKPVAPENTGAPGSSQVVLFQVTDASGIGLPGSNPAIAPVTGDGGVVAVASDDHEIPGAFKAQVRLGPAPGANVFRIDAGTVSQTFTITGKQP